MFVHSPAVFMLVFATLFLQFALRDAFSAHFLPKLSATRLSMAGGRSLEEKSLSKRQMFKQLREKLIEASQMPGFWDDGDTKAKEVVLYLRALKDGQQIADCPFGQFLQLVLQKKGISYEVKPILETNKPELLTGKQLPVIVHNKKVVAGPIRIAEYIEKVYPQISLTRQGAYSYQEILEKTHKFFPALTAFVKNQDEAKDALLQEKFEKQLDMLDEILRTTPGQYLGGLELTLADLYLLPQLFHATVALDHFKDFEVLHMEGNFRRPALESYISRMLDMSEFNKRGVYVSVDKIIHGWKQVRAAA